MKLLAGGYELSTAWAARTNGSLVPYPHYLDVLAEPTRGAAPAHDLLI
jgi:hypothetical protein